MRYSHGFKRTKQAVAVPREVALVKAVSHPPVYLAPQVVRELYGFFEMFPSHRRAQVENGLLFGYVRNQQYVVVSISTMLTGGTTAAGHRSLMKRVAGRVTTPLQVLGYWASYAYDVHELELDIRFDASPLEVLIRDNGEISIFVDDVPTNWTTDDSVLTTWPERVQTVRFEISAHPQPSGRNQATEYSAGYLLGFHTPTSIFLCAAVPFDLRTPLDSGQRLPDLWGRSPCVVGIYTYCREPIDWALKEPVFGLSHALLVEWPDGLPPSARILGSHRLQIDLGFEDAEPFSLLF